MADGKVISREDNPEGETKHVNQKYDATYHPEHYANYAVIGCSHPEIAAFFGIDKSTLGGWIDRYPAMSRAKNEVNINLTSMCHRSLVKRAKGYGFKETKTVRENGEVARVEVMEKQIMPDVAAAKFLISKHSPEMWGEKEVEGDNQTIGKIEIEVVTSANG